MVCGAEIGASRITQPFSRKENDGVLVDGRPGAGGRHHAGSEAGGQIAAGAEGQRAALGRTRIDLDEMNVAGPIANEIQAV